MSYDYDKELFGQLLDLLESDLSVDRDRCTPESNLVTDLLFDSLAFAIGIVAIEEDFGVVLAEEQLMGCSTLGDVVRAIGKEMAGERAYQ